MTICNKMRWLMNFLLHLVNVFEHLYVAVSVCVNLPLPYCLRRFFV